MLPSPKIDIDVAFSAEEKGNQLFPVFIKLNKLRTLLIGGGNIGLEKLTAILNNSQLADVKLVAKEINSEIIELAKQYPNLKIVQKSYDIDDLNEVDIVYSVVTRLEISKLQVEVEKIDPNAFMVMNSVKDTKGGIIKKRPLKH